MGREPASITSNRVPIERRTRPASKEAGFFYFKGKERGVCFPLRVPVAPGDGSPADNPARGTISGAVHC
jgi:hypothetical protein